ncbi:guanine nucleotide-binding protein G(q) subunit alpha-like [Haematobia irritans]|uniref:guanine nucleotide-binding protein G(q) subunit alpha-like n=1 Tax=Haematobia irritans TaxID=7368 RepID=UPI003F4FD845
MSTFTSCFLTNEKAHQRQRNKELKKTLEQSQREKKKLIQLLLLGTGESGKSTFIRQMRIIYDNGYTDKEKKEHINLILQNIFTLLKTLVEAMDKLHISYEHLVNCVNAEIIKTGNTEEFTRVTDFYIKAIKELWYDKGVQECYKRRREYQIGDSLKYYLDNIDRIAAPDYLPNEGDILHLRIPTSGVVEHDFKIKRNSFRIIDVGGQRSERRKWLYAFDQVKVILFLVAISEYDQTLNEENNENRLKESMNVFKTICECDWFAEIAIAVFFNKIDILREKIMYSDLVTFFPEYKGPAHDYLAARDFIEGMFLNETKRKNLYKHFTCATDTKNITVIFKMNNNNFGYFSKFLTAEKGVNQSEKRKKSDRKQRIYYNIKCVSYLTSVEHKHNLLAIMDRAEVVELLQVKYFKGTKRIQASCPMGTLFHITPRN